MSEQLFFINQMLQKYSGSPWRFNEAMLRSVNKWEKLSKEELYDLIADNRDSLAYHYSLVPFFAKYVGVDIRCIYYEVERDTEWESDDYKKLMSIFPESFNIHSSSTLDALGHEKQKPALEQIRIRLIEQGLPQLSVA